MSQPLSPKPGEPPNWSSDYFREVVPAGVSPLGRGLVGHVPLVAICLIVQGVLEIVMALFFVLFGILFLISPDPNLASYRALGLIMVIFALPGFVCGPLRIFAGIANLRHRRRLLGMTALGLGLLTMMTGYCAPTSIGLAVYGLIVYLNDSVIEAFAMGDAGKSNADIQAVFPANR